MPAIITNKFRVHNASSFINSSDNYYMFIGRPQGWTDDFAPDAPIDSVQREIFTWDDIMAMKRIDVANMSHGIRRVNWTSSKFYDIYRHNYGEVGVNGVHIDTGAPTSPATLAEANYFVVTANFNVYVCISNNGGAAATVDPSTLTPNANFICTGADNYIWKYIGRASTSDVVKFKTTDYQPIKTLTSAPASGDEYETQWNAQQQSITDQGAIFNVVLGAGGTGYGNSLTNVTGIATVRGDGTGCVLAVNTNGSGVITKITVQSYGSGYSWAVVEFNTGAGATGTAIITPTKGLGADPVVDLLAYNVIINARFEFADGGDFPVTNDYRRIGMLVNPLQYSSVTPLSSLTADAMLTVKVSAGWTGNWVPDAVIKDSTTNAHGRIVDVTDGAGADTGKKLLRIIRTSVENALAGAVGSASFVGGNPITIVTGGVASGTIDAVVSPEVEPDSGKLIYLENRRPIMRSVDQAEDLKAIFEF